MLVAPFIVMRLSHFVALAFGLICMGACIDHPDAPIIPDGSETTPPLANGADNGGSGGTQQPPRPPSQATPPPMKTQNLALPEVVYLEGHSLGLLYTCMATLVAKDRAVTAAHCLVDKDHFEIIAPSAGGKRVAASSPTLIVGDYGNDPTALDIGFLNLNEPIELPVYASLTDISGRVADGEEFVVSAITRTKETPADAPLQQIDDLALKSTTKFGYTHGFGVPLFSIGGDSGAGFFLVEDGQITHKLIGVERQPESTRQLDHLTRIDDDILPLYSQK